MNYASGQFPSSIECYCVIELIDVYFFWVLGYSSCMFSDCRED